MVTVQPVLQELFLEKGLQVVRIAQQELTLDQDMVPVKHVQQAHIPEKVQVLVRLVPLGHSQE